jgi:hypothetical protein
MVLLLLFVNTRATGHFANVYCFYSAFYEVLYTGAFMTRFSRVPFIFIYFHVSVLYAADTVIRYVRVGLASIYFITVE